MCDREMGKAQGPRDSYKPGKRNARRWNARVGERVTQVSRLHTGNACGCTQTEHRRGRLEKCLRKSGKSGPREF